MADVLQLEIVTPERHVVNDVASEVQIPALNGYLGILPGHAPLITELGVGEIAYRAGNGKIEYLAVAWGFAEVLPDKVTILAETAEKPHEIDIPAAREAQRKAEEHLQKLENDLQKHNAALLIANTRLQVATKGRDSDVANIVP